MHGVQPGDILRLNRASNIGSRDFTLKAAAASPKQKSPTASTILTFDPVTGNSPTQSHVMPAATSDATPHFVHNQLKGRTSYLDERLFVCRAVVLGVEAEPMRTKEKTKRRQRKIKTAKSKHKFTVLKIKEVGVRSLEEVEGEGMVVD